MKTVQSTRFVEVPEGVTVEVNGRDVTVSGPRGALSRSFGHLAIDVAMVGENNDRVRVEIWMGNKKQLACLRTVCSHIENMIRGVTVGFKYKMRFNYAHFPINVIENDGVVEIRNFLGEKRTRTVRLLPGVEYVRTSDVKDQIELIGNDVAAVSLTAARIQQSTLVRNKDIRKFLDGIYVSSKGPCVEAEFE